MEALAHNNDMLPNFLNPSPFLLLLEEQQTIYSYTLSPSIRLESKVEEFFSTYILIQVC